MQISDRGFCYINHLATRGYFDKYNNQNLWKKLFTFHITDICACNCFIFKAMREHGVYNMVFSSSTTVYGPPQRLPIDEYHPRGTCTNPYGKTKYFIEEILIDTCKAESVS